MELSRAGKGNTMLSQYQRFLDKLRKIELFLAISVFGFIILIITMQVIFRYFFNKPFSWVEELASLLLIYLTSGHINFILNFLLGLWISILNPWLWESLNRRRQ